jgi:hypothetical protein
MVVLEYASREDLSRATTVLGLLRCFSVLFKLQGRVASLRIKLPELETWSCEI